MLTYISSFLLESLRDIGNVKLIGTLSLGLGMATDVVIAASLCYFLGGLRTGHRKWVSYLVVFYRGGLIGCVAEMTLRSTRSCYTRSARA